MVDGQTKSQHTSALRAIGPSFHWTNLSGTWSSFEKAEVDWKVSKLDLWYCGLKPAGSRLHSPRHWAFLQLQFFIFIGPAVLPG